MNLLKLGLMGAAVVYGQDQVQEESSLWSSFLAKIKPSFFDYKLSYIVKLRLHQSATVAQHSSDESSSLPSWTDEVVDIIDRVERIVRAERAETAKAEAEAEAANKAADLAEKTRAKVEASKAAMAESNVWATKMSSELMILMIPSVFLGYKWLRADAQERATAQRIAVAESTAAEVNRRITIIEGTFDQCVANALRNKRERHDLPPPYAADAPPPYRHR